MQAGCGQGPCRFGREICRSANAKAGDAPALCRKGHTSVPVFPHPSERRRLLRETLGERRSQGRRSRFVSDRISDLRQRSVLSFFAPSLAPSFGPSLVPAPPTVSLMVCVLTLPSVPLISTVTSSVPVKPALLS